MDQFSDVISRLDHEFNIPPVLHGSNRLPVEQVNLALQVDHIIPPGLHVNNSASPLHSLVEEVNSFYCRLK